MEVKVYFKDGTVEAHHIPEVAGMTYTIYDKDTGRERGRCGTDLIADVVERELPGVHGHGAVGAAAGEHVGAALRDSQHAVRKGRSAAVDLGTASVKLHRGGRFLQVLHLFIGHRAHTSSDGV